MSKPNKARLIDEQSNRTRRKDGNKDEFLERTLMAAEELHGVHEVRMKSRRPPHPRRPGAPLPTAAAAIIPRSRRRASG